VDDRLVSITYRALIQTRIADLTTLGTLPLRR
jgi:hypothetical protein